MNCVDSSWDPRERSENERHHASARSSDRIPDFAHDDLGHFPWGINLYPDSLIIASAEPIYRAFVNDPRLDTATIRKGSDFLPASLPPLCIQVGGVDSGV